MAQVSHEAAVSKYQLGLEPLVASNLSCGEDLHPNLFPGPLPDCMKSPKLNTHVSFLPSGPSYEAACNMAAWKLRHSEGL